MKPILVSVVGALIMTVSSALASSAAAETAEPQTGVRTDPANTVLRDGFDGKTFSPEGHLYYRKNFEQRAGTVTFQSHTTRNSPGALKLSVRPFCPEAKKGCSERAEIWEETQYRVPYHQGVWYGFSVKFGEPIPTDDHRYLIAQWKREIGPEAKGDFSPFLALRVTNGKLFATIETNYIAPPTDKVPARAQEVCDADQTPVSYDPGTNQMRALIATDDRWDDADGPEFRHCTDAIRIVRHGPPLPRPQSGWMDFAIYTQPDANGNGRIEIFANGQWIITATGHIGHDDPGLGKNQYFKFGPYRAAGKGVWTMYYDNFIRSPSCTDLLPDHLCSAIKP